MNKSPSSYVQSDEQSTIDLTPMLDVVFIMLIFFIVTATFVKEAGIEVTKPEAQTVNLKLNTSILVAIDGANDVWIDQNQVEIRDVRSVIQTLHAENPNGAVVIQVDKESEYDVFRDVMLAIKDANVADVAVSAEQ